MTKQIIPFGKYKDQPIEVLAADQRYLDWLLAQSWFKDRYSELFTIVINNFQEPADTPEHNAMHMKFLDDGYVANLLLPISGFEVCSAYGIRFEFYGWDVFVTLANRSKADIEKIDLKQFELCEEWNSCGSRDRQLEIDIELEKLSIGVKRVEILVELKPTISDDFPSVLRQMKSAKQSRGAKKVLVVGTYTGIGATKEQFVQFMANEGIHVIFAE